MHPARRTPGKVNIPDPLRPPGRKDQSLWLRETRGFRRRRHSPRTVRELPFGSQYGETRDALTLRRSSAQHPMGRETNMRGNREVETM
jgi:hypothetical protein